jgi:hypothetical protein
MMENIVIPQPEKLENLKKSISKDGAKKLHILSDFDRTLTTAFVDGKSIPSLISIKMFCC